MTTAYARMPVAPKPTLAFHQVLHRFQNFT